MQGTLTTRPSSRTFIVSGLDGLTLRKLAARLGVQQPTLYWHLPNKAALLTAIAELILEQQFAEMAPPEPDERWQDWLLSLAEQLRGAPLAHPDGARIISASQLSLRMAAISELAMSTLVACGVPLRAARLIVLTLERFAVAELAQNRVRRAVTLGVRERGRHGRAQLPACFAGSSVERSHHRQRLPQVPPPQPRSDRLHRPYGARGVAASMDVEGIRPTDSRFKARIIHAIKKVLQSPRHITDIGWSAENISVGSQDIRGSCRECRPNLNFHALNFIRPSARQNRLQHLLHGRGRGVMDYQQLRHNHTLPS
ncbi:hypothetical protein FAGKG844_350042 [Frankia sp. AgKG'84/4]